MGEGWVWAGEGDEVGGFVGEDPLAGGTWECHGGGFSWRMLGWKRIKVRD